MPDQAHTALVERAVTIIAQSRLSPREKETLEGRIPFVAEAVLQMFVDLCEEDPFAVDAVVKNMQKKLEAQGNLKKIHEIVKQERRELEEVLA